MKVIKATDSTLEVYRAIALLFKDRFELDGW